MQAVYYYQSPLGEMIMTAGKDGLTGLWFADQKYAPESGSRTAGEKILPVFAETVRWLDKYFSGDNPDFLPELDIAGTDFPIGAYRVELIDDGYANYEVYANDGRFAAGLPFFSTFMESTTANVIGRIYLSENNIVALTFQPVRMVPYTGIEE